MHYALEGQDIGMFGPEDLDRLKAVYLSLCVQHGAQDDVEAGRRLAKSIIQLYRHGVRDHGQLVAALDRGNAA